MDQDKGQPALLHVQAEVLLDKMFFRAVMCTTELPDGRKVELSRHIGEQGLVVSIENRRYMIKSEEIIKAVLRHERILKEPWEDGHD